MQQRQEQERRDVDGDRPRQGRPRQGEAVRNEQHQRSEGGPDPLFRQRPPEHRPEGRMPSQQVGEQVVRQTATNGGDRPQSEDERETFGERFHRELGSQGQLGRRARASQRGPAPPTAPAISSRISRLWVIERRW